MRKLDIPIHSEFECKCTSKTIEVNGSILTYEAFCKDWSGSSGFDWCYLSGGLDAASCPGAVKSGQGDFYWSDHPDVCGVAKQSQ